MMEFSLLVIGINFFIATSFNFNAEEKKNKYAYSRLERDDKISLLASVEALMLSEKLYLKPGLTLEELGQLLQKPSKQISQVLNELKNLNFNEFLNHYRVEEAKQLLSGDHIKTKTLEWVQEKAGFGSKSAFFNAFKTIVGVTPSEYKRKKEILLQSQANRT